ncbi:MAG: HD-GYP domain-containing protein [Candidatus Xenobia bacterium]
MQREPVSESDADRLTALVDIGREFCSSLSITQVLNTVIDRVIAIMHAERGILVMADENGELVVKVARNINRGTIEKDDFKISRGLVEQVAQERKPLLSNDATQDPRFDRYGSVMLHSIRSIMAVPMELKDRLVGVLYIDNRIQSGLFEDKDLRFLNALASLAAVAIENAHHYERTKDIVVALANAIEAKDQYTGGHIDRVARMAVAIGKAMGIQGDELQELEMSSILHDVGKIGIDDRILRKPSMLDPEERAIMEMHPVIGATIVQPIPLSAKVKSSVRHHQERWDGKGYPDRLAGEAIPLFARITAVADAWDTITSNRPYRAGRPVEVAVNEIKKCGGTQFDPQVVEAFLRVMESEDPISFTQAAGTPETHLAAADETASFPLR